MKSLSAFQLIMLRHSFRMIGHVICPVAGNKSQHHFVRLCNNEMEQSYRFSQRDGAALKLERVAVEDFSLLHHRAK
jgi:hypothetical protein